MLKWTGKRNDKIDLVGIGLEAKNLDMLCQNRPIHIQGSDLGIVFDILIYYGKDMDELMRITKSGIGPETVIHDERK